MTAARREIRLLATAGLGLLTIWLTVTLRPIEPREHALRVGGRPPATASAETGPAAENAVGTDISSMNVAPDPMSSATASASLRPALESLEAGEYEKARRLAEPVARAGDPAATHLIGYLHEKGLGVKKDPARAAGYYREAADAGDPDARLALGLLYLAGLGVDRDAAEAARWFSLAAKKGDVRAMIRLGALYTDGLGVARDRTEGLRLFEAAAAKGDPHAAFLAGMAFLGDGEAAPDYVAAGDYLARAARAGHGAAAYHLALLFRAGVVGAAGGEGTGDDATRDHEARDKQSRDKENAGKAVLLMRAAADAGHPPAMTAMGLYVHEGEARAGEAGGAPADWFERAASAGDLQGTFLYAVALANGDGRPRDVKEARRRAREVLQNAAADDALRAEVERFLATLKESALNESSKTPSAPPAPSVAALRD